MKIFGFFYSEKVIFHKNKKNSIIVQQEEDLAIHTTMDDNMRVWDEAVTSRPGSFIFFNSQTCLIYKIKQGGMEMGKFSNSPRLHYFCFYFLILIFLYLLFNFYYIKINIFHKNKNIMNFINYLLKNIIIIIIIYIKV